MTKFNTAKLKNTITVQNIDTILLFSRSYQSLARPINGQTMVNNLESRHESYIAEQLAEFEKYCIEAIAASELFDQEQKNRILDVLFTNPNIRKNILKRDIFIFMAIFTLIGTFGLEILFMPDNGTAAMIVVPVGILLFTIWLHHANLAYKKVSTPITADAELYSQWLACVAAVIQHEYDESKPVIDALINVELAIPLTAAELKTLADLTVTPVSNSNIFLCPGLFFEHLKKTLEGYSLSVYQEIKNNSNAFISDGQTRRALDKILKFTNAANQTNNPKLQNATKYFLAVKDDKQKYCYREGYDTLTMLFEHIANAVKNHPHLNVTQRFAIEAQLKQNPAIDKYKASLRRSLPILLPSLGIIAGASVADIEMKWKLYFWILGGAFIMINSMLMCELHSNKRQQLNSSFVASKYWIQALAAKIDAVETPPVAQEVNHSKFSSKNLLVA